MLLAWLKWNCEQILTLRLTGWSICFGSIVYVLVFLFYIILCEASSSFLSSMIYWYILHMICLKFLSLFLKAVLLIFHRSLVSSLSEDEHGLIAQYCQSLSSSDAPLPVPRSPLQIMAAVDAEQKDELEQMIRYVSNTFHVYP